MDLIDRGKFWDNLNDEFEMGVTDAIEAVNNALDDTPTVDAVPVIRCRDCKDCRKRDLNNPKEAIYKAGTKWCIVFEAPVHDDGFCSWADLVEKPVESVDNRGSES